MSRRSARRGGPWGGIKALAEMTAEELRLLCEEGTGLKYPDEGSREDVAAWLVATFFVLHLRYISDNPELAKARAATQVLQLPDFERHRPFAEEALGRPFTDEEIANREVLPPEPPAKPERRGQKSRRATVEGAPLLCA